MKQSSASHRWFPFALAGTLGACASTTLETPADHPANASAPTSPVTMPKTLRAGFEPSAPAEAGEQSPDPHHLHHGHEHGEQGAPPPQTAPPTPHH